MSRHPLLILIPMALMLEDPVQESVRQELARKQQQTGLTLVDFNNGIKAANFADRSFEFREVSGVLKGANAGAVSRDGESVAFLLSFKDAHRSHLAVARSDGRNFREYPNVESPFNICWSNDKSKLALRASGRQQPGGVLYVVDLEPQETREIEANASVTSQCWSPDDKQVVYEVGGSVRVFELKEMKHREVVRGRYPTWSPDGNWIAFYDGDGYYAIRPSGADRKLLFMRQEKDIRSGLWWSPDGGIVAYLCVGGRSRPNTLPFANRELRVRRLLDGAEDWVLSDPDVPYVPSYQWVMPASK